MYRETLSLNHGLRDFAFRRRLNTRIPAESLLALKNVRRRPSVRPDDSGNQHNRLLRFIRSKLEGAAGGDVFIKTVQGFARISHFIREDCGGDLRVTYERIVFESQRRGMSADGIGQAADNAKELVGQYEQLLKKTPSPSLSVTTELSVAPVEPASLNIVKDGNPRRQIKKDRQAKAKDGGQLIVKLDLLSPHREELVSFAAQYMINHKTLDRRLNLGEHFGQFGDYIIALLQGQMLSRQEILSVGLDPALIKTSARGIMQCFGRLKARQDKLVNPFPRELAVRTFRGTDPLVFLETGSVLDEWR